MNLPHLPGNKAWKNARKSARRRYLHESRSFNGVAETRNARCEKVRREEFLSECHEAHLVAA